MREAGGGAEDVMNCKLDSGIEALARGAVGATVGSLLGLSVGFVPILVPMVGLPVPWSKLATPMTAGLWFLGAIGIGTVAGAAYYLRRGERAAL